MQHVTVRANGAAFHVARIGKGRPLLLLHGWPEFWLTWEPVMQRLADRGCRFMQGFLFSRPVPPDQFAQLLAQGSRSDWCASAGQCPPPADGGEGSDR